MNNITAWQRPSSINGKITMHTASEFFELLYQGVPEGFTEIRMLYQHLYSDNYPTEAEAQEYERHLLSCGIKGVYLQYNPPTAAKNGKPAVAESWSVIVKPVRLYRPASEVHTGNFDVLADYNRQYHIYHRTSVSHEPRSRKQDISLVTALWMDVDGKTAIDPENSKPAPVDFLLENRHRFPPTVLINSGGGFHAYWLLKEPLVIDSEKTRREVERTMHGLIFDFGNEADVHAKDITRILRTPGFYNIKPKYGDNPPQCEIAWLDDSFGDRYHFASLHQHYAELGAPVTPVIRREIPVINQDTLPKWIQEYLANGVSTNRNSRVYAVARWYNDVGKSQSEAEQDILPRATADGLSQTEANATIRSAFQQARNLSNTLPKHLRNLMAIEDDMESAS